MTPELPPGHESITVTCASSSHARGKVAKIETFVGGNGEWITAEQFQPNSRAIRQHGWLDHKASGDLGENIHSYECKLCGLKLECGNAVLQRVLNALAAQGVSDTTLHTLTVIASKQF